MLNLQIKDIVIAVLKDMGSESMPVTIDYPSDPKHGDYATNVALVAARKLGKNPMELAEQLAGDLRVKSKDLGWIEKVEVAKPGFINFWITNQKLIESTGPSNKKGYFADKKIMVEYTDPNPFKELHIGHLYSNIIGESLCRIFEANGAEVRRVDYYGDVGMHVAKSVWGLMKKMRDEKVTLEDLEKKPLTERIAFLGEGYALGSNAFTEDPKNASEIKDINYLVYMSGQEYLQKKYNWQPQIDYKKYLRPEKETLYQEVKELYEKGKDWSLENFEILYKRLGTKFDNYYPESIAGERGYKIVKENIENGIFVQSEGAIIFPGEEHGLHTRVFINTLGLPTYEAKELGLAPWKYEEFKYDLSFIVTATEIAAYFNVLVEALKKVNPELGAKTKPLLHGMVKLPEGKMSSRSGNVITVNWLIDEAKRRVMPLMSDAVEDKDDVAEKVGIAAVKYAFLRSSIGKDITFDLEESVNFEGNSGPYLQYTYARTQSVLAKSKDQKSKIKDTPALNSYTLNPEERQVLRLIARFEEIVEEAAVRYAPSGLATYLFELAQGFNLFYQKHQILKGQEGVTQFRLSLTEATGKTLKQGLNLLGIQAPEKM